MGYGGVRRAKFSIGILTLVIACANHWSQKLVAARRHVLAGLVLGTMSLLSWSQCWIYSNREVLWLDTLNKNPRAEIAYTNLGMLYLEESRYSEALNAFEHSSQLKPNDSVTMNNLGVAHSRLGQLDLATENFRRAIELDCEYSNAYNNLGAVLCDQGRFR